jgi:hypothetical protein
MEDRMRKAIVIFMVAATAASAGCAREHHESGGPTVERNFQVGGFERIEVAGGYDVEVHTGAAPSARAKGPEKDLERLVIEVKGDRLLIHPRERHGMFHFGWRRHGKTTISVTVPQLRGADVAGSGDIRIDNVRGDSFAGKIAGSGGLSLDNVEVKALEFSIAGSGSAQGKKGRAQNVSLDIAGSGDIDTKGVTSETASVSIAGSGNIAVHASSTASVSVAGSGDVDLTGGAKCSITKHGSGDVRCS